MEWLGGIFKLTFQLLLLVVVIVAVALKLDPSLWEQLRDLLWPSESADTSDPDPDPPPVVQPEAPTNPDPNDQPMTAPDASSAPSARCIVPAINGGCTTNMEPYTCYMALQPTTPGTDEWICDVPYVAATMLASSRIDCCRPKGAPPDVWMQVWDGGLGFASNLIGGVVFGEVLEEAVKKFLKRTTGRKISLTLTKGVADRFASRLLQRRFTKLVQNQITTELAGTALDLAEKAVLKGIAAKLAAKESLDAIQKKALVKVTKKVLAAKLVALPLKMLGNAFTVFDIVGMVFDFLDPYGYNNFQSNKVVQRRIDAAEYHMQRSAWLYTAAPGAAGADPALETLRQTLRGEFGDIDDSERTWPVLFPAESLYDADMDGPFASGTDKLQQALTEYREGGEETLLYLDALYNLIEQRPALYQAVLDFNALPVSMQIVNIVASYPENAPEVSDPTTMPLYPKDIDEQLDVLEPLAIKNMDSVQRDSAVFRRLLEKSTEEEKKHLAFYPAMSGPSTFGIGLSEEGVRKWNERHRPDWEAHFQGTKPQSYVPPPLALFKDEYRKLDVYNPGTSEKPNLTTHTVPTYALGHNWCRVPVERTEAQRDSGSGGVPSGRPLTVGRIWKNVGIHPPTNGRRIFNQTIHDQLKSIKPGKEGRIKTWTNVGWKEYAPDKKERTIPSNEVDMWLARDHYMKVNVAEESDPPKNHYFQASIGGNQLDNAFLAGQLRKGRTSFTLEEVEQMQLPPWLDEEAYIVVDGKCYSPTHKVSIPLNNGGMILCMCELDRPSNSTSMASSVVKPKDYGVYFNDGTFHDSTHTPQAVTTTAEQPQPNPNPVGCVYTPELCNRYGMKHKYNYFQNTSDCWIDGGQSVAEFLFGTTFSRAIVRAADDAYDCAGRCAITEYCVNKKCKPKKKVGKNVGWHNGWKCLTGKEVNGYCHDGNNSVPAPTNVGWTNSKYCASGHEYDGKCLECRSVEGHDTADKDCDGQVLPPRDKNFARSERDCSKPGSCYCKDDPEDGVRDVCVPRVKNSVDDPYVKQTSNKAYKCLSQKRDGDECADLLPFEEECEYDVQCAAGSHLWDEVSARPSGSRINDSVLNSTLEAKLATLSDGVLARSLDVGNTKTFKNIGPDDYVELAGQTWRVVRQRPRGRKVRNARIHNAVVDAYASAVTACTQ